jgi:tetratricopeptide (TPR) repeat protein
LLSPTGSHVSLSPSGLLPTFLFPLPFFSFPLPLPDTVCYRSHRLPVSSLLPVLLQGPNISRYELHRPVGLQDLFLLWFVQANLCYTDRERGALDQALLRNGESAFGESPKRRGRAGGTAMAQDDAMENPQATSAIESDPATSIPGWQEGLPLVRIFACGPFTIEILQEVPGGEAAHARYAPLPPERLHGRGPAPALTFLKLLVSQKDRYAPKDWLIEHLRGDEYLITPKRLENIVSFVRQLLSLPDGTRPAGMLRYVRASHESGDGYRLAPYPLIWTDVDALASTVRQACLLERFDDDPLTCWERAYQLASRGTYLSEEPYSQWADSRREEVEGYLQQCVHALARLLLARYGAGGEEEVLRVLRLYVTTHPTNEDALRPLMELLGKQERYQEALDAYARFEQSLEEEGLTKAGRIREPDQRTRDLADYLRLKEREPRQIGSPPISFVQEPSQPGKAVTIVSALPEEKAVPMLPAATLPTLEPWEGETRHLIGREDWLATIIALLQSAPPKKLMVLHGPVGVGKSSELQRLTQQARNLEPVPFQIIAIQLSSAEHMSGPDAALDVALGTILAACGHPPLPPGASQELRINLALSALAKQECPLLILLDNAEDLFAEEGQFASCWQGFLTQFLRRHHRATLLLATKDWRGWTGRESVFVAACPVPPLSTQESIRLLHRLGLRTVPAEQLRAISEWVGGIPLCLEWIAQLAHDPLVLDDWKAFTNDAVSEEEGNADNLSHRFLHLLEDPSVLEGHLAARLEPLLHRILERHLSAEAKSVLERLALAPIPLGKPALQALCSRPGLLKELRDTSLLAASSRRVQVLPIVASTIRCRLSVQRRYELEETVIEALVCWVQEGTINEREAGSVVAALATLLLTHQRLLDAAQLLIRFGWRSFHLGYGPRLAQLAPSIFQQVDWHNTPEHECAGLVLIQILFQFLGQPVDPKRYVDYQRIREAFLEGKLRLQPTTEGYVIHLLLLDSSNALHFTEAQALLDAYSFHLKARHVCPERNESWLQKQALLLGTWCEYLEERRETEKAHAMREQVIALYRERATLLSAQEGASPLKRSQRMRARASCFSYLGYHLNRIGHRDEALQLIDQAIALQEQGFANMGVLASSYSDKAQILIGLGRFQEAILFDEKAMAEIQRCADAGDALSQEDIWTSVVNRGRLYLRLGRIEEAEQLLLAALPRLHDGRRKYRMFAQDGLNEIQQWRQQSTSPHYQLDWRWIERYRELCTYDSYWWLTWAGPFTEEEQQTWNRLSALLGDETVKAPLGELMKVSRERELQAALEEQREPRLHYPAIALEDVRRRIAAHLQLKAEIERDEPHVLVRRLYQGAIEEELDYLHLIEATYEGNTQRFWEYSLRLFPLPTHEEMRYALAHIQRTLARGLHQPETAEISQHLQAFLHTHLPLSISLEEELPEMPQPRPSSQPKRTRTVSARTAQRFFEALLQESGYEGWKVMIDANATGARVEQGARCLFLPGKDISLQAVKHLFVHELAGHVARCMAGERSLLGLLGIHTKNVSCTEEGFVLYHEREIAALQGQTWDDSGMRLSTFAIGLACGIMGPPQTFRSICSFIESFSLLRRLLNHPEKERERHQKQARIYALDHCLRVFRGVPDLTRAGVCYPQDAIYLHGLFMIEKAVAQDKTVLDRLAVGKVALELLPEVQELGMTTSALPSLYPRAYDPDLDAYILSFEEDDHSAEGDAQ